MELLEITGKLNTYYAQHPYKLPVETLPLIFDKKYNESFISDWLAYLIDPLRNGFGIEPLAAICDHFHQPLKHTANIRVIREHEFIDGRKIDLLIYAGDLLIGIENKIRSWELENQTEDYYNSLRKICENEGYGRLLCIYLKPEWNDGKPGNPNFKEMTYGQLAAVLRRVPYDIRRDMRKSFFLYEFILHVEEYLMNSNNLFDFDLPTDVRVYMENRQNIETAKKSFEDHAKRFDDLLAEKVASRLSAHGDYNHGIGGDWIQWYKDGWEDIMFHLEIVFPYERGSKHFIECNGTKSDVLVAIHLERGRRYSEYRSFLVDTFNPPIKGTEVLPSVPVCLDFGSEEKLDASVDVIMQAFDRMEYLKFADTTDKFVELKESENEVSEKMSD